MNPYTVKPRRNSFYVTGPNGYAHKATGQAEANREADALNRAYRHGYAEGSAYAEQLDADIDAEETATI